MKRELLFSMFGLIAAAACSGGGVVGGECRRGFCQATRDAGADDASHASDALNDGSAGSDALDAGSLDHDAGDGDFQDGGGGDATSSVDSGCKPPYDTPQHCGDCSTTCGGSTPICSPVSGGFACVPACTPPLTLCDGSCVDLDSDPDNCGSCFNSCPSGICQAGQCVGQTTGHIVLACMSYEVNTSASPQTALLGNAVFLPGADPVRILAYAEYAPKTIVNKINQALAWAGAAKGRAYVLTQENSGALVGPALSKTNYDVLLVYDQTGAPKGVLGPLGASWAAPLAAFIQAGGVVFAQSGGGGTGEMDDWMTNAGLLPVSDQPLITGSVVYNVAPLDAVGLNVLSPFLAQKRTCTFTTTAVVGPTTVFVVGDGAPDAGPGNPVVVHRIP